ncbi:helicase RepA family protein [Octadecabacter sp. G9-8]|uniref:Helicase RepA family protein n=1 Tax=Octadecabacter dasysiphoniae TaxID=2909341 RepID=A0ABS9CVW4_9RHOB|nr:AAA family ATPase [Octadecabacter dasysiphoniae]MCF2870316.1 helicase RepA family protein [Octadecabacter dasysiphoniae]
MKHTKITQAESPLDRPLTVAFFADRKALKMDDRQVSLRELATENPVARSKDSMGHIKLGKFSGETTPRRSYRHNAAHLEVSGIEGDYDEGTMTVDEAAAALKAADVAAMIYTTPSHLQSGKGHRWRVLCPLSVNTTPEHRTDLLARVNGALGGTLSAESFTSAQSFAFGQVKSQDVPDVRLVEGRYLDQADDLDAGAVGRATPDRGEPDIAADLSDDPFRVSKAVDMLKAAAQRLTDTGTARNEALCREAFLIGGLIANSLLTPEDVADALLPAMVANGYVDDHAGGDMAEVERILNAQLQAGAREPFDPGSAADTFDDDTDDLDDIDAFLDGHVPDPSPEGLTFLTPGQCATQAPRDYLVKRLVAPGQVGCIFGEPGAGKSLIAPALAYAVAQGSEFFGLRTKPGTAFYIACEDEDGMAGRVAALYAEHGSADDFQLVKGVSDLFSPGTIKGKGSPHLESIRKAVKSQRPKLVIIDTLAMAMPGVEENDANGMNRVVQIGKLLARYGAAVIFIHHGTKAEGSTPRGHSVFNGALDFSLMVKAADQGGVIRGVVRKNRNGPPDLDIAFRIGTHHVGADIDGEPIYAPYCEPCDPGASTPIKALPAAAAAALTTLDDLGLGLGEWVPEEEWRDACTDDRQVSASEILKSRQQSFRRQVKILLAADEIEFSEGQYRIPDPFADAFDDAE